MYFVLDYKLFENGNFDYRNVTKLIKFYTTRKVSCQFLELLLLRLHTVVFELSQVYIKIQTLHGFCLFYTQ